jgi:hypothetical protein
MKKYGLTLDDRKKLLDLQKGACAICGINESESNYLQVDHDHSCCPGHESCGQCIRGLICAKCNKTLGHVDDNQELIRALVDYLVSHAEATSP